MLRPGLNQQNQHRTYWYASALLDFGMYAPFYCIPLIFPRRLDDTNLTLTGVNRNKCAFSPILRFVTTPRSPAWPPPDCNWVVIGGGTIVGRCGLPTVAPTFPCSNFPPSVADVWLFPWLGRVAPLTSLPELGTARALRTSRAIISFHSEKSFLKRKFLWPSAVAEGSSASVTLCSVSGSTSRGQFRPTSTDRISTQLLPTELETKNYDIVCGGRVGVRLTNHEWEGTDTRHVIQQVYIFTFS